MSGHLPSASFKVIVDIVFATAIILAINNVLTVTKPEVVRTI
jgi:hypothetical protein